MNYINKYDRDGECSKVGHKAESDFSTLARSRGWEVSAASKKANMHKHIDFIMEKPDKDEYMQVDVKSRKRLLVKIKTLMMIGFGWSIKMYKVNWAGCLEKLLIYSV